MRNETAAKYRAISYDFYLQAVDPAHTDTVSQALEMGFDAQHGDRHQRALNFSAIDLLQAKHEDQLFSRSNLLKAEGRQTASNFSPRSIFEVRA